MDNMEKSNKKGNKIVLIILALILIIGLIVGIIYLINSSKNQDDKNGDKDIIDRNGKTYTIYSQYNKNEGKYYFITQEDLDEFKESEESFDKYNDIKEAGKITCETNDCVVDSLAKDYVVVIENNTYYLYNYALNEFITEIAKVEMEEDYIENNVYLLSDHDNTLYGVAITTNDNTSLSLYFTKYKKLIKDIHGYIANSVSFSQGELSKYDYIPIIDEQEKTLFYNIKEEKVMWEAELVKSVDALYDDDNVYVDIACNIYDINGKLILKDTCISSYGNKHFMEYNSEENSFNSYDTNGKLVKTSKKYTDLIGIYQNYAVVLDGAKILVVDENDKVLTTLMDGYDSSKNSIIGPGLWHAYFYKEGIYITISDNTLTKDIVASKYPEYSNLLTDKMTDNEFEYVFYYIPKTNETGFYLSYGGEIIN